MGTTKIKSPQIGQYLSHTYLNHTNVYISSDLGDAFSDYVGGFLDVPGNSWGQWKLLQNPWNSDTILEVVCLPRSRLRWSRKILGREGFAYSTN